jgi:PAS domain S-box-containing protein
MLASVINQQLQTEQVLRKRETELSTILENANDAYVCINQAGVVSAWNQRGRANLWLGKDEAVGRLLEELIIHYVMQERHRKGMQHYLQSRTSDVIGHRVELAAMKRDGSIIPVEVRIQALQFEDEILFSAFLHDISARKQMETLREQEARIDALTGLPNRRAFFETLPRLSCDASAAIKH